MHFALECLTLFTSLTFYIAATRDQNMLVATFALTLSSSGIISITLVCLSSALKKELLSIIEGTMVEITELKELWC